MTTDFFNYLNQFTNQLSLFNTVTTNTTSSYQWTPLPQDLGVIRYVPPPPPPPPPPAVQIQRKTDEACAKALALLLDNLTPEQKDSYLIHGFIKAKGGQTGRTYKIFPDRRVWCWQTRKWYCIVLAPNYYEPGCRADWVPPADMVLAKKLMIEGAEDYFLQTAIGSFGSAGQDA